LLDEDTAAPVSRKRRSTESDDYDGTEEMSSSLSYRCGMFRGAEKRRKSYLSAPSSRDFCEVPLPAGMPVLKFCCLFWIRFVAILTVEFQPMFVVQNLVI